MRCKVWYPHVWHAESNWSSQWWRLWSTDRATVPSAARGAQQCQWVGGRGPRAARGRTAWALSRGDRRPLPTDAYPRPAPSGRCSRSRATAPPRAARVTHPATRIRMAFLSSWVGASLSNILPRSDSPRLGSKGCVIQNSFCQMVHLPLPVMIAMWYVTYLYITLYVQFSLCIFIM